MEIKKIVGKSKACPIRFSAEVDAYIQRLMKERQLGNRNFTVNLALKEHMLTFELYQSRIKIKILKLMRDWHIKPGDLE